MPAIPTLTPLGLSALALLAERPMHPYEMYQLLVERNQERVVKVRPGSLYHTVGRLAGQGFLRATGTQRAGNRPERTTYEITAAGRALLDEQLRTLLAVPANEYPRFPQALSEAHNLSRDTVVELCSRRLDRLRAEAEDFDAGIAGVEAAGIDAKYWIEMRYQQAMLAAETEWLEAFLADLASGRLAW
ncbi:PadR family transcriptional regulator [Arthrobacter sp. I2-34]|uniref:PadR family transcriptional regulator n=1 Tax=Arthrobacter hankyongi TaxID=2904801 RepID=A0ABS9LBX8_9MICC|nr:PadR family transcriptional regulator [Arthrobacter hankyongi]MCG2624184.1 PadR family transcriptional regulator [Arthrobacter hankyongi]